MTATTAQQSRESLAFLQRRVALLGFAGASCGGFFLVFRTVMSMAAGEPMGSKWDVLAHASGVLMSLLIWVLNRSGERSQRFIHIVEAVGLWCTGASYCVMGAFLPPMMSAEFTVMLALTFCFFLRAVFVPSSGWRTFILTFIMGVPLLVLVYAHAIRVAPGSELMLEELKRAYDKLTPDEKRFFVVASMASISAWWTVTVGTCTVASKVIYGLRREVRKARQLGQYTLEEKLGEGGMGSVYRASHAMLRRPTAVKLLHPDKTSEAELTRFEREVQLTAQLTHPNTVTVFDYGRTPDGVFYYAMELLDGASLAEVVELDGAQPAGRVVHIMWQVAGALTEAHCIGLIHRDIKPANIILTEQGGIADVAKVVDFGLVKQLGETDQDLALTAHNTVVGTPLYMSPEVIRDPDSIDGRTDLYALGAVGYFLLTGTDVFDAPNVIELCSHHLKTTPDPPSSRIGEKLPAALEQAIMSCLAKDPDDRPADAGELFETLEQLKASYSWSREDARSWWQEYRRELEAIRSRPATGDHTISQERHFTRAAPLSAKQQAKLGHAATLPADGQD